MRKMGHEDASKNPESYIEALVQVRNKYFDLIKETFSFNALMRRALDQVSAFLFLLVDLNLMSSTMLDERDRLVERLRTPTQNSLSYLQGTPTA